MGNAIVYKKNDPRYTQIYQNYDWAYNQYIIKRKSYDEIANELNVSKRVIIKWFSEKHKLNRSTIKHLLKLNNIQSDLVVGSLLGDGHINKRIGEPMFIVSHSEKQKDYLYWKYDILKNLCNKKPSVYDEYIGYIKGKSCRCKKMYRINTKIVTEFEYYKNLSIKELINKLNDFSLSIFMLDDGCCDYSLWTLCVAKFLDSDKEFFIKTLNEKFGLIPTIMACDNRYISFNRRDSDKLTKIILKNIPNDLDIIKYKIIYNKTNKKAKMIQFVNLSNGDKVSLAKYFKLSKKYKGYQYKSVRTHLINLNQSQINEHEIIDILGC